MQLSKLLFRPLLALVAFSVVSAAAPDVWAKGGRRFQFPGLSLRARVDLKRTGVTKYLGKFQPQSAEMVDGWTRYTFDTKNGAGPICIDGSPFRVFTERRNPRKVVIFLSGGGACWQGQYGCAPRAPMDPPGDRGVFADAFTAPDGTVIDNPFADYSKVVVSYCDGSVFGGDNEVNDLTSPFGPIRYHRGVRNLSAAMDVAKADFPRARRILFSGASAGGFGVSQTSATLVRFVYPFARLRVLNDSGPVNNPAFVSAISAQANDWQFEQFYPRGCKACGAFAQPSEVTKYWLAEDNRMKAALFSFDGDAVIRFFVGVPLPAQYRSLLLSVHDPIVAAFPGRYNRFIANGTAHTILGGQGYYLLEKDGVVFYEWLEDFMTGGPDFRDIVEPAAP